MAAFPRSADHRAAEFLQRSALLFPPVDQVTDTRAGWLRPRPGDPGARGGIRACVV